METTLNKLITLNNDEKYAIIDAVTSRGIKYYYVVGIDEEKEDLNGICRILKINEDKSIEVITNTETLKIILPLFLSHYTDLLEKE